MRNLGNNCQCVHNLTNLRPFFQSEKPFSCLGLDFANVYVITTWASIGKNNDEVVGKFPSSITELNYRKVTRP